MYTKADRFNRLDFDEKAYYIWNHATYLVAKYVGCHRINLYYLDGFYVQLYYNRDTNKIENIEATMNRNVVDEYLDVFEFRLV